MNLETFQRAFYQKLRRREQPVYAGNFVGGVSETLSQNFSLTKEIFGEKRFESLCRDYSVEGRFHHWSRYRLGEEFPAWFASRFKEDVALYHLLRFEWIQHEMNLWANSPLPQGDRLQLWLTGAVSDGILLSSACKVETFLFDYQKLAEEKVLNQGTSILLMGVSLEDQIIEAQISADEKLLCESLAGHLSFEQWLSKIPPGSHLENESELAQFLGKLIPNNWLSAVR